MRTSITEEQISAFIITVVPNAHFLPTKKLPFFVNDAILLRDCQIFSKHISKWCNGIVV